MTTPVPYIAPWASDWTRYSTQVFVMQTTAQAQRQLTSPSNQWWRIIFMMQGINTDATVADRPALFTINSPAATGQYRQPANVTESASSSYMYLYGPNITGYSNTSSRLLGISAQTIPDVLWPPLTIFGFAFQNAQAGDAFTTTNQFAVEVYTEQRDGSLTPATIPTPILV